MKYIMLEIDLGDVTKNMPFIFPNELCHKDVAKSVIHLAAMKASWSVKVVSAGYINGMGMCHGKSTTLNIGSRDEDTHIIKTYDYTHGYL